MKVLVQPEKDSFAEFHGAEFADAQKANAAVADDGLGQLLLVCGFAELVDQLGRQDC